MSAISIQNLQKTYSDGTQALRGINLEVEEGDFCALLGSNGAGKTTIIGILTGLVIKTGGAASVFGHDVVNDAVNARKAMGVVPQEMNFNMFEKVQDIVVQQAGYFGIPRKA
ncbi:MAG: ATP-binding cassette domain-containing protein, partial [Candidatus Omnitrophica bacterium]|nr:ATP-binding cassette domain-containing protein [Candidatus Omnitrophota bacterium]